MPVIEALGKHLVDVIHTMTITNHIHIIKVLNETIKEDYFDNIRT